MHKTTPSDPEGRFWGRYERGFAIAWTVVIYMVAVLGTLGAYAADPAAMAGWPIAGMLALLAGYFVLYHRFAREVGCESLPLPLVVFYGCAQLAIVTTLASYNSLFVALLYAALAQLLTTLPYRRWPLPIGVSLLAMYFVWGVHVDILSGNPGAAVYKLLQPITWIIVFVAITMMIRNNFKQTETVRELRRARAQLEAGAAQAEELAVLRERARLAREFHDNLGHALVVVNVKLEAAQRLYQRDRGRGDAELEATRALVRETMAELRRSLADLRAPLSAHSDLAGALRQLADEAAARTRLQTAVEVADDVPPLGPQTADALWHVAREALANVERHSGAAHATISLQRQDSALLLRVADDGAGIQAGDQARPGHYGLLGMRERVAELGGTLRVATGAAGGTVVEALLYPGQASATTRMRARSEMAARP